MKELVDAGCDVLSVGGQTRWQGGRTHCTLLYGLFDLLNFCLAEALDVLQLSFGDLGDRLRERFSTKAARTLKWTSLTAIV
jgi:hypothetical protein